MFKDKYPLWRDPYPMFIDGAWVTSQGGETFPVLDPKAHVFQNSVTIIVFRNVDRF